MERACRVRVPCRTHRLESCSALCLNPAASRNPNTAKMPHIIYKRGKGGKREGERREGMKEEGDVGALPRRQRKQKAGAEPPKPSFPDTLINPIQGLLQPQNTWNSRHRVHITAIDGTVVPFLLAVPLLSTSLLGPSSSTTTYYPSARVATRSSHRFLQTKRSGFKQGPTSALSRLENRSKARPLPSRRRRGPGMLLLRVARKKDGRTGTWRCFSGHSLNFVVVRKRRVGKGHLLKRTIKHSQTK